MLKLKPKQLLTICFAILGWAFVYLNQEFDVMAGEFRMGQYAQGNIPENGEWAFIVNKSLRFLLNDIFSVIFIYGLFNKPAYVKVAFLVMALGLFILLPAYLILALHYREAGFNLLTFLHRITMNPWLMIMLVPAFYYKEKV